MPYSSTKGRFLEKCPKSDKVRNVQGVKSHFTKQIIICRKHSNPRIILSS